ncbi:MAG: hypothetical protein HYT79_02175 [Elusimicrobia bacterium]|nr:hypothetical protein [Elusimicrobiota bacterium]
MRVSGSTGEAIKFLSTDFKNVRTNFHVVENPNTIHIRSIQYASRRADKVGFFVGVTAGVGGFLLSPSVLLITELKSKGRAAWVADEGGMFCLNAALAVGFYFLAKGVYNTWFRDGVYQRAYQYAQDNPVVTDPDRND